VNPVHPTGDLAERLCLAVKAFADTMRDPLAVLTFPGRRGAGLEAIE
jgi:hypothetical protein